jgi:Zinc carboxypeptidase
VNPYVRPHRKGRSANIPGRQQAVAAAALTSLIAAMLFAVVTSSTGTRAAPPQVAPTRVPPTATPVPSATATPQVYRFYMAALIREDDAWRRDSAGNEFTVLGWSVEGREIVAYRAGDGERVVVLVGGLHQGPEGATTEVVEGLLAALLADPGLVPEELTVVAIPVANPDGAALGTRRNARDVDLNRNWPTGDWTDPAIHGGEIVSAGEAPLSEPETASIYRYFEATRPLLVMSWHGYASIVEGNDIALAEELAGVFADAAAYELLEKWPYYPITGEMIVALAELGIPAFDVELDPGTTVAEDIERNLAGLVEVLDLVSEYEPATDASATPVP